jgi:hypothetical protein
VRRKRERETERERDSHGLWRYNQHLIETRMKLIDIGQLVLHREVESDPSDHEHEYQLQLVREQQQTQDDDHCNKIDEGGLIHHRQSVC